MSVSIGADPGRVDVALDAAGIRPERRGRARLSRLTKPQRELYRWVLRRFATVEPPSGEAVHVAASDFGVALDDALASSRVRISCTPTTAGDPSLPTCSRRATTATAC